MNDLVIENLGLEKVVDTDFGDIVGKKKPEHEEEYLRPVHRTPDEWLTGIDEKEDNEKPEKG